MKTYLTALFAALAMAFYGLKFFEMLPLSAYQMTIGTLLALWSFHLSLKIFLSSDHMTHVLIMIVTAVMLTLDKMFAQPGIHTIYLLIVIILHTLALLGVLFCIPFASAPVVAHAQQADKQAHNE